ncbi:MAG: hypothetical protein D6830_00290 [Ignavibacteria bacterium]|nr:MAG: hypothetical protein D6830_00290 [Ignavibacteria bacterium]
MKVKNIILVFILVLISSACRQGENDLLDNNAIRYAILLEVSQPKAQDIYHPGDIVPIKWRVLSEMKNVSLQLYKKTEMITIIAPPMRNTGSFEWTIPADINQSHHYKIRVTNPENPDQHNYSEVFYILKD